MMPEEAAVVHGPSIEYSGIAWGVAEGYIAKDGVLNATGPETLAQFGPGLYPEHPQIFAKLRDASDKQILEYARSWGSPYHSDDFPGGIPLAEIRREASRVWLIVELIDALSGPDTARVQELLRLSLAEPTGVDLDDSFANFEGSLREDFKPRGGDREGDHSYSIAFIPFPYDASQPDRACGTAGRLVSNLLNESLSGTSIEVMWNKDGGFRYLLRFRSLIEVIYSRVAELAFLQSTAATTLNRCIECGNLYVANRSDQVFCPPDPRMAKSKSGRTWSRCGDRYRARERRNAKKEGKG